MLGIPLLPRFIGISIIYVQYNILRHAKKARSVKLPVDSSVMLRRVSEKNNNHIDRRFTTTIVNIFIWSMANRPIILSRDFCVFSFLHFFMYPNSTPARAGATGAFIRGPEPRCAGRGKQKNKKKN